MKWGVVGKGDIPHVAAAGRNVIDHLREQGQDVVIQDRLADALDEPGLPMTALDAGVDLWLSIGGDGSVLYTQHHTTKPVLGINAGAVGFLTEAEIDEAEAAIDAVIAGEHTIEERSRLALRLGDKHLPDAVNEVTLQTSRIAKLIRYRVEANGEELDVFRGDGIIVSTPTGSTGYAMSVGGPLVHPRVSGIVVAPIAPFKLASRPWVIPADTHVEITLLERDSAQGIQQGRLVIDGYTGADVDTGATLHVQQSEHKARYVRLGDGFYERVRTKLSR